MNPGDILAVTFRLGCLRLQCFGSKSCHADLYGRREQ